MLPSYPTENYQMDMGLGSNKYPPQAPGSGKFVQAHGGQAYPPPGMESYMSQGMDPSMHPAARKAPGNPQASMGYGQGGMYNRGGMDMPMSPSNAVGMYGAAPGYHTGGYPQNLYAGGHPQRQMPPHHSMNPMMDGYGDRGGYGSHGMPPGHGGMHNPAMRMRYSAMMGQERWPPPAHQYMQQSQHHQAMASGPVNRFQPPGGAPPDWAYPGGGEQFPGYPSTAMQARPAAALSSDERSSMPASPYMGMNAYSPGNQAYRQPHPSSHMKSSNPSLAGSPMGGYEQQAGSQQMQGNNMSMYLQQQQQAQAAAAAAAGNSNALDEIAGSNNNMNISAQRMQAYLNKQDASAASPLSSDYMYPFQGSQDAQGNQNAFGLGSSAAALPVDLGSSPAMKDIAEKQRQQAFDKKVENLEATVRSDFLHEEDMDLVKSLLSEDNLGTNSQDAASVGEFGSQGEDGIPDPSSLTASPFVNSGESLASPFSEQGSDAGESPVTEKNKILDGKSATSSLQPHLLKQYALSQEPARKEFLDNLFAYLSKEGKTISKAPVLSGQLLDLFKLYTSVQRHKGFVNVCASHLWKKVIEDLDVANPKVLAAHNLRQQYIKFLLPYECALRDENYDDVLAVARRKWHMNSSTVSASADADKDVEEKGDNTEPVGQNSDSGTTTVSHSDITIPGSDSTFSQSTTTNTTRNLEQRNLGFPMVPKSNELSKSPRIQEELTSSLPTSLQQQRDPLDSLSSSLNPSALNKQAHFNCSSPKNMQNMQPHYSNSPSTQTLNTGGLSNDWNRRPEMWNQQQYPPEQAFKNMPSQPKGYYGDPYRAALPRHPMYGGGMPHSMGSHPVEYAEYQRHGIRPPVPYQPRQPHPMQQMMSDPYRPYRFGRSGMMEYQMHGSGGGMMPPGSPMLPEWAWKQQQQQQQQQHHQHQQQQMRMGSPYGSSYGSHLSPQQQSQQQHHHHRVPSPMMLQQQQQQVFAARLEQQQHHQQQQHQQHHQQQHWQDASLRMSKAPYPTSAAQPATIKSQAVIGMSPQQHMASTSVDAKTSSLTAALEKKVPPEWVNTVEGTKPVFSKKRKLTSNDCGPVEILRLMMSLRSGVLSETTWALDTLNIMLHDDRTVIYFSLKHHNNLCNILTDHLKQCLHDIFGVNFGALLVYDSEHEGADLSTGDEKLAVGMMDILTSDYDILTDKKRKCDDEDESSSSHCPIPVAAVYSKCYTGFTDTTIYVQTHIPSHDNDNSHYCSQNSNEHENKKVIQCIDETPTAELLRREGICLNKNDSVKDKESSTDKSSVNLNEECEIDNGKVVNENEETAMECDENLNGGNSSTESKVDNMLCRSEICEELKEENEICSSEEVPLCLTRLQQQSLQARCLCVSNILRSLSFIPGNDTEMSRSHGLLRVLGRLLLLHHRHIVRSTLKKSLACSEEEAPECSALPPSQPWWQDCLDQLQENTFVILANISGQLDLSKCPECIAYPILDGLIHWCVCTSARALDPLPSSAMVFTLSPQRLVLEALAKMSIVENNIDLILATPPFNRLDKLYAHLVQLLSHKHQPVVRQFALVLLSNLAQGDETASHQIGQQECILSLLLESIEDAEHAVLANRTKHPSAVANVEDPNVLSVAMLRRAAITLHCLAKVPQNRPQFLMFQDRLLYLSCSEYLEQSVASIMMDVMYELGKVG